MFIQYIIHSGPPSLIKEIKQNNIVTDRAIPGAVTSPGLLRQHLREGRMDRTAGAATGTGTCLD